MCFFLVNYTFTSIPECSLEINLASFRFRDHRNESTDLFHFAVFTSSVVEAKLLNGAWLFLMELIAMTGQFSQNQNCDRTLQ